MAEETLAAIDADKTEQAEEGIADFLFGPDEGEEYEPNPEPVVEGDDESEDETEEKAEDDEEVEAKDEDGPEYVEVEFEGQLYEVPSNLKDALLRQQDYTTKTQEVSTQRKEVEVQLGTVQQQREQYEFAQAVQGDVLQAQQLESQAEQLHEYLKANIDTLSSTEIEKIRFGVEDARRQRDELVKSIQGKTTEFQQAQEQSRQELLNKGTEVLRQKIPGWGEEQQRQVRDYALSNGFTEAEISQVVDPRQVEVLYKASQYDALKSGVTPAVKKVQGAPTIKPKARDPKTGKFVRQQKLSKALKSNLSAPDKASLIGEDIASRMFR